MSTTNLQKFRRLFPVFNEYVYLDVATRAPLSLPVRKKVEQHLDECETGGHKEKWIHSTENVRAKFAKMIGAKKHEIAFTKNTSEGLNIVAAGLNWNKGDKVLIPTEIEHPNNVYPWLLLQNRGVEVKKIETPKGFIDFEKIIKAIDKRTRVITLSFVAFITGSVVDIKKLSDICRQNSVILVVDAVQGVGAMPLDVKEMGIDILSSSAHKRLLGLYGLGFFYCSEELLDRINPSYIARRSILMDDEREYILGEADFKLVKSAGRFEIGNHNYLGISAAEAALEMLEKYSVSEIYKHISYLSKYLRRSLTSIGIKKIFPIIEAEEIESGIISFSTTNPQKTFDSLVINQVKCALRYDLIRLSLHAYNTKEDIDKVVALIDNTV